MPLIDTQHKVLIEHINKLEVLMRSPQIAAGDVERLLQFLESYAANHFKFEEQCMHRFHCPTHEENCKAHAQFLDAFARVKADYKAQGATPAFLGKLFNTASTWIHNHILRTDVKLRTVVPKV